MNHYDAIGTEEETQDAVSPAILREKLIDALTPGYQAEFDPDEAEQAGAFVEDALSEEDAAESSIDACLDAEPDLSAVAMPAAANDGEFGS
jgi:hypothetical protein